MMVGMTRAEIESLIKWHEKRAYDASRRGAHTIASKHAKTAHIIRALPLASPKRGEALHEEPNNDAG